MRATRSSKHPSCRARSSVGLTVAMLGAIACSSSAGANGQTDAGAPDATGTKGLDSGPSGDAAHPDAPASADASGHDGSTSPAGTVGGVPGGVAGPGTTLAGCEIFPADNAWNVAIDGPSVQVIHTYDSELAPTAVVHPDLGGYATDTGGIPFNTVPATQADLPVDFTVYASSSDPGPGGWVGQNPVTSGSAMGATAYPFFVGMKVEGDPPAGGTPGSLPGDQHAIVLQQGASGCTSYEAWNSVVVSSPPFPCANGAVFDLSSNALRPAGSTSGDAAGLSILAGLVRLSEVEAGAIHHAIRMTFQTTQQGYIAPATHAAGSQPFGSAYPPMGLRLRLKASVDLSAYTPASQVILTAMKKYGLLVADNGSDWFFTGDSDDGWTAMAPDGKDTLVNEVVGDFRHLTGADFEAVDTGAPVKQ